MEGPRREGKWRELKKKRAQDEEKRLNRGVMYTSEARETTGRPR